MRHAKKQENVTHSKEKNQAIETNPGMTQVIELVDKYIIMVITTVFLCSRSTLKSC